MIEAFTRRTKIDQPEYWIQEIGQISTQALLDTYPQLKGYKDLLFKGIEFLEPSEIIKQERADKPKGKLRFFQQFLELGVPDAILDPLYYNSSLKEPFYINYQTAKFYYPTRELDKLKSTPIVRRLSYLVSLGDNLIEQNLVSLACQIRPYTFEDHWNLVWGIVMGVEAVDPLFDQVLKLAEGKLAGKNKIRLRRSRDQFHNIAHKGIIEDGAKIVGVGARAFLIYPDQTIVGAELNIGEDVEQGTIHCLAKPAKERLRQILSERFNVDLIGVPADIDRSKMELVEKVQDILDLNEGEVLSAYLYSRLAKLYLQSDDPRLNPFRYVEVGEE